MTLINRILLWVDLSMAWTFNSNNIRNSYDSEVPIWLSHIIASHPPNISIDGSFVKSFISNICFIIHCSYLIHCPEWQLGLCNPYEFLPEMWSISELCIVKYQRNWTKDGLLHFRRDSYRSWNIFGKSHFIEGHFCSTQHKTIFTIYLSESFNIFDLLPTCISYKYMPKTQIFVPTIVKCILT